MGIELVFSLVALSVGAPTLTSTPLGPALVAQADSLTGLWEGRATGQVEGLPPEGVSFSLRLEASEDDEVLAQLTIDSSLTAKPTEADFDEETGELIFRCDLMGILVDVELVVEGEALSGTATGLGMRVELEGKRTTRELPRATSDSPGAARPRPDLATLDLAAWREDLAFLAEELPRRHVNAFHTLSSEEWTRGVEQLGPRLEALTPAGRAVALAQLVAAVGDAHTELALAGPPFEHVLPVRFTRFEDGLFVTVVDESFEAALGLGVRRIGRLDVDEALAAVGSVFASENDSWPRVKAPGKLIRPGLLAALGVSEDESAIPLVLEGPDGANLALTIEGNGSGRWLRAPDPDLVAAPLWRRRTQENYWYEAIDEGRALYWAYNRCIEDPARPMRSFVSEISTALSAPGVELLVIDLRHNSGGNSGVLGTFVSELAAHPRLAEAGSLRVLIGPSTYSSGMLNAHELRARARARLYGEPTGGKPNSYGELRVFALPHSGLEVYHSTKYFRLLEEDSPALEPDVHVPLSSQDFFAGIDPVLARALAE